MATDPNPLLRRTALARILRQSAVGRQSELVTLLRREGFDATQSSVSRDLRELGVAKAGDRYLLPAAEDALDRDHGLEEAVEVMGEVAEGLEEEVGEEDHLRERPIRDRAV